MKKRKAQAALEFLMTYGWAILVVLVVIGALAYFGVLNPSILLPEKCTMEMGFDCKDFVFNTYTGAVILDIQNGRGDDLLVKELSITGNGIDCSIDTSMYPLSQTYGGGEIGMLILNGQDRAVSIPCNALVNRGGKLKSRISMKWAERGVDAFEHTSEGEILGRMESNTWPTEQNCQDATLDNVCTALQLIFPPVGDGFRGFACECEANYPLSCEGACPP